MLAEIPLVLMLVGLTAYAVLGGADFGAGLWELTGRGAGRRALRDHTHRSMAPVWEANHVWLIFVLVMCWTVYPEAFSSIVSTLAIPFFLAGVGIIMRGAAYALRAGIDTPREEGLLSFLFSVSSLLTPFALGTMIGAIASGRVPVGNAAGDPFSSWLNPTSLLIGVLAVAISAYVAAVYLAGDASRMGARDMAEAFRRRALGAGLAAGALAIAGPVMLRADARPLYDGLVEGPALAAVLASALAGLSTLALLHRRRYEPARYTAGLAVATVIAGWALAQEPRFLPGLTVEQAAAGDATIVAVLIGFAAGALLLVPSLIFLFRLVLTGRFDPAAPLRDEPPARPVRVPGDGPRHRLATSGIPAAAVLTVGALVTFVSDGALRGAGVATMLAGAVALFLGLAALDDEPAGDR